MTTPAKMCAICTKQVHVIQDHPPGTFSGRRYSPGITLGCDHSLHLRCANEWIYDENSGCPDCKKKIHETIFLKFHRNHRYRVLYVGETGYTTSSLTSIYFASMKGVSYMHPEKKIE